jgi:myosin-5
MNFTKTSIASLSRQLYKSEVRCVVWMQSCVRRRYARRELNVLKAEARSVSKFKEISYRLENKVVELTQNLQERTTEKKKLQSQVAELEQQLQQWINRHEEADTRAKQHQSSLQAAELELVQRSELLAAKTDLEKKLEEALVTLTKKEAIIQKLSEDILRQATQLETQQRIIDSAPTRNYEDNSVIMTLKNEVSSLREQLNRANALNALTRTVRNTDPPLSPTFAPNLRAGETASANGPTSNGSNRSHQRRHSSAGGSTYDNRSSYDDILVEAKRNQVSNPRAVSMAFNGEENVLGLRFNGLPDARSMEDHAEEKIRLMLDSKHLDEDVLDGLIRGLKIPVPSITNAAGVKEILFPANLISLITNEMWKYGLIAESERFLANVMQSIQAHVMVCLFVGGFF